MGPKLRYLSVILWRFSAPRICIAQADAQRLLDRARGPAPAIAPTTKPAVAPTVLPARSIPPPATTSASAAPASGGFWDRLNAQKAQGAPPKPDAHVAPAVDAPAVPAAPPVLPQAASAAAEPSDEDLMNEILETADA